MTYQRAADSSPLPGRFVWVIRSGNTKPDAAPCFTIWDKGTGATLFRESFCGAILHNVVAWCYAVPVEV